MTAVRTVEPAYQPVTLTQAKLHCKVDTTDDDTLFTGVYIPGAVDQCEQRTGRSIMLQTWRVTLDEFADLIELPWPTVLSVTSVEYKDLAGVWQTLSTSVYEVDLYSQPARITLADAQLWPDVWNGMNVVRIIYTAGFASGNEAAQQAAVPANLKAWVLLGAEFLRKNRGLYESAEIADIPTGFYDGLLDRHKVWRK